MFKRALGKLRIALSLGGFLLSVVLDDNCDPAMYIEALL